ncbi:hypothetical protein ARMGADRAFT_1086961 [Armillaria gallica]|uniref:Protein kinase domain-containing protein n=1 Tax=Armillaria gallica TaxID=47427 RepID=A0A2H3DA14_ARMGA|nr:hypothetical protein ARMGADRAFT_1086961 [Armillaria gallica]
MPNGESMRVILLEYIEGIMLAQLEDKYPSHASPQGKPTPKESYTEWREIAKELRVPALRDMSAIVECGVVHCNFKTQNITITSTTPRQVVYIDFAFSTLGVPQHPIEVHKNSYRSVAPPPGCCRQHTKDVEQWLKKNSPGGLMYQSGCNSEY